jgi:hypothetical protein
MLMSQSRAPWVLSVNWPLHTALGDSDSQHGNFAVLVNWNCNHHTLNSAWDNEHIAPGVHRVIEPQSISAHEPYARDAAEQYCHEGTQVSKSEKPTIMRFVHPGSVNQFEFCHAGIDMVHEPRDLPDEYALLTYQEANR